MAGIYGCLRGNNSDSSIMAAGPPDVMITQDPAEAPEECPGKKKSKFQTFKNFFVKKKRKEAPAPAGDTVLKSSQSSDNVNTPETTSLTRSEKDQGSGSKINMGSKALSHDSVFVSDSPSSVEKEGLGASQDSIHGKVKSLQLQLKQAIRLGSPPSLMCMKRADDGGAVSEDDGLPCSPPEYSTLHTVMTKGSHKSFNLVQRNSSLSLEGTDSDDDQLSCDPGSRSISPLVVPAADFSQPASPTVCLDNTAAKHRLALRHHACTKRKPTTRVECRSERDSFQEERLSVSIPESVDEGEEEDVDSDQAKAPATDEEAEDEQTDSKQSQHASAEPPPPADTEDELGAGQEVSHGQDAPPSSSSPSPSPQRDESDSEECLPAEPHPKTLSQPPSLPSSRASSVDCLASLETPAGDFLLEAGGAGGEQEEESSLLQEVLSSLRGPLSSSLGLETEGGVLVMQEEANEEQEEHGKVEEEDEREVDDLSCGLDVLNTSSDSLAKPCDPLSPPSDSPLQEDATALRDGPRSPDESREDLKTAESEDEEDVGDEEEEPVVDRFQPQEEKLDSAEETSENSTEDEKPTPFTKEWNEGESQEKGEEEEAPDAAEDVQERHEEEEEIEEDEEEEALEGEEEEEEDVCEERKEEEEIEEDSEPAEKTVVLDPEEEEKKEDEGVHCGTEVEQQPAEMTDLVIVKDKPESLTDLSEALLTHQSSLDETITAQTMMEANVPGAPVVDQTVVNNSEVDQNVLDQSAIDQPVMDQTVVEPSCDPSSSEPEHQSDALPPSEEEEVSLTPTQTSTGTKSTLFSFSSEQISGQPLQAPEDAGKVPGASEQGKGIRFTIAPAWQRTLPGGTAPKDDPPSLSASPSLSPSSPSLSPASPSLSPSSPSLSPSSCSFSPSPAFSPSPVPAAPASSLTTPGLGEAVSAGKRDGPVRAEPTNLAKPEVNTSPLRTPTPVAAGDATAAGRPARDLPPQEEANPENPFGVRLRKTSTSALLRYASVSESDAPAPEVAPPARSAEQTKRPAPDPPAQPISSKPALPRKPELQGESGGKTRRMPEPIVSRVPSGGSESPSWIHMARQKQRVFKENSVEEAQERTIEKEVPEKEPIPVLSSPIKDHAKPGGSPIKVSSSLETSKAAVTDREGRKALTSPGPPAVAQKPTQPQPGPPASSPKAQPPQPCTQAPLSQRAMSPSATLPQDEPPWLALAKKKAKAWSEMPQIVQ
ncbi:cell surface glycoprotein 1 [Hypomesus transpacificus]|uniref:cell surface glycoprotein 1 n=1 Tax=Hypomesus transpacificus TaxID=137520 RepID=UPI001F0864D5|nr:cell surface glycoprotein 1 [Hypomesus transpacificus]